MKKILAWVLYLLLFTQPAWATLYLDDSPGQDCSAGTYRVVQRDCAGSGTGDQSYDTLAEFSSAIVAQATNYLRPSTAGPTDGNGDHYYVRNTGSNTGALDVSQSGTSGAHTIVRAYTGEGCADGSGCQVFLAPEATKLHYNPTPGQTSPYTESALYYPNAAIHISGNYVEVRGVKTYGQVIINGVHDSGIYDSDIGGAGPNIFGTTSPQSNTVHIHTAYAITVDNNYIHHSAFGESNINGSCLEFYGSTVTVTNNYFYDCWGAAVNPKDAIGRSGTSSYFRYNVFMPSSIFSAINGINMSQQYQQLDRYYIDHNIFIQQNVALLHEDVGASGTPVVGYNTYVDNLHDIYNYRSSINVATDHDLHYKDSNTPAGTRHYIWIPSTTAGTLTIDNNFYYATGVTGYWTISGTNTSTWATWQATGLDASSTNGSDPGFNNLAAALAGDWTGLQLGTPNGTGAYALGSESIGPDWSGSADTTPPTVTSASVNGTTVTITCDETIVTAGYDDNDCDLDCTTAGQNIGLTSPSGSGASRTFTAASNVAYGDTCNLDCTLGADDIEDTSGNDMVTFSNTNVSVNTPPSTGTGVSGGNGSGVTSGNGSGVMSSTP